MRSSQARPALASALLALGLSLVTGCRSAQPSASDRFLQIKESDLDGGTAVVPTRPGIVDINSTLDIRFDKPALAAELERIAGPGGPSEEQLERLEQVSKSLKPATQVLESLRSALDAWGQSDHGDAANRALTDSFRQQFEAAGPLLELVGSDEALRARFNRELEASLAEGEQDQLAQDRLVLELASEWVESERAKLEQLAQESQQYLRMGAWLARSDEQRPIHLRGLDDLPEGEFYEVARWSVNLSDEQKRSAESIAKLASEINANGGDPKLVFRAWVKTLREQADELFARCRTDFDGRLRQFEQGPGGTIAQFHRFSAAVSDLRELSSALVEKYAGAGSTPRSAPQWLALLGDLHADALALADAAKACTVAAKELGTALAALPADAKAFGESLLESECVRELERKYHLLAQELGLERLAAESAEFGEAVLKLDITQFPEATELDLRTTGFREAGDRVLLRLATGKRGEGDRDSPEDRVLSRELDLERVLPHLDTSIGLIFANPTSASGVQNEFQAAPAYSVLYKEGSRESRLRNALFDFGIGVNVAALDFDNDEAPEPGLGVVVSTLRNYLQVGYGYNVFEDTFYWFFSANLPLQSFELGAGSSD
ncbi:MAG: hypothetical protein NTV21_12825 [Planctomycetota bacterium]|nr:hypothetical protein [Planctomycetota bacterium]